MYEMTVILLLLAHATIYRLDKTLDSNLTMTASPAASLVCSILEKNCAMKRWQGDSESNAGAKTHNNYL
jgi:hypothetical protein